MLTTIIKIVLCLFLTVPVLAVDATFKGPGNCEVDHSDMSDRNNVYSGRTEAGVQFTSGKTFRLFRLKIFDVATALGAGATITGDATCSLYCVSITAGFLPSYAVAYEAFKPYNDDDMNYHEYDATNHYGYLLKSSEGSWESYLETGHCAQTTAQNTHDGPIDSSGTCATTSADLKSSPMDSVLAGATSTWYSFTIPQALVEAWYDGSKEEYGIWVFPSIPYAITGGSEFASEEHATSANHPRVTIPYTPGGGGQIINATIQ